MDEISMEVVTKSLTPTVPVEITASVKRRRRSSFVNGRKPIKGLVPGLSVHPTDLCNNIPEDLPDDERLEKLHQNCLEYCLDCISREFQDVKNLEKSFPEVRDAFEKTLEELKAENAFKNAVMPLESVTTNLKPGGMMPEKEQFTASTIEDYKNYTAELEKESNRWDSLCAEYEASVDKVSSEIEVDDSQYQYLSAEQQEELRSVTDFAAEWKKLEDRKQKIRLHIAHFQTVIRVLDNALAVSDIVYKRKCQDLSNRFLGNSDNSKQLLEDILKFPNAD